MFEGVFTPFFACCADLILSHMGLLFVVLEFEPATGANRNTMDARASFPAADGAHSRQCSVYCWSGQRESNSHPKLGRLLHYHYAIPALPAEAGFNWSLLTPP